MGIMAIPPSTPPLTFIVKSSDMWSVELKILRGVFMNDFRSSHFTEDKNGRKSMDYVPMRMDKKDDYTIDLAKGFLNSYLGLPLIGIGLMVLSPISKEFLSQLIAFCMRYGLSVSKETILGLYAVFSAAPLGIGSLMLYKGSLNLGRRILRSKNT